MTQQPHLADRLDALVHRAHVLSFDLREPARSHAEVERRVDEGRVIAREMDGLFRARS
jgi:hypothetical protein